MLSALDALRVVEEARNGAVVVTTMMANRLWRRVSQSPKLDLPVGGAMGKASSIGLGLALAQPERKVIIVDGDGSLLMNLGSLVTIASKAPTNLYHLVLENGVYAITGGQPVPGAGRFNLAGMAREAGYRLVDGFAALEEFAAHASRLFNETGPVFVSLKIEPEVDNTPIHLRPRPARRMADAVKDLRALLIDLPASATF
jgi:sulfopyruvate decarboxylase subunit beta